MERFWWWLLTAVLVFALGGCKGMARPNWLHPGTAKYQQERAHQFDPYPEVGSGPEIVGARPREFQVPPPEVQKAHPGELRKRWFPWQWEWGWQ